MRQPSLSATVSALILLGASSVVSATEPATALLEQAPPPAAHSVAPAGGAVAARGGLRAYADPATGKLIEAPTGAAKSMPAPPILQRDFNRIWEERLPDGTGLVHLEGQMRMTSVATIDANGNVLEQCLPGSPAPAGKTVEAADAPARQPDDGIPPQ